MIGGPPRVATFWNGPPFGDSISDLMDVCRGILERNMKFSENISNIMEELPEETKLTSVKQEPMEKSKKVTNKPVTDYAHSSLKTPENIENVNLSSKKTKIEVRIIPSQRSGRSSYSTLHTKQYKLNKNPSQTAIKQSQYKKQRLIVATCADVGFKKYAPKKSNNESNSTVDSNCESQGQSGNTEGNLNLKRMDPCNDPSNSLNLRNIEQNKNEELKKNKNNIDPEEASRFWHKQDLYAQEQKLRKLDPDVCLCDPTKSDVICPTKTKTEICDKSIKNKKSKADQLKTWLKADTFLFSLKSKSKGERGVGGPVFLKNIKHKQKKKITSETCICEPGKFELPQKGKFSKNTTDKIKSVIEISCPFKLESKKKKKNVCEITPPTCICNRLKYIPTQKGKKFIKKSSESTSVIEITCPAKVKKMKEDKKKRKKREKQENKEKKKKSKQVSKENISKSSHRFPSKPKKVKVKITSKTEQLDSDSSDEYSSPYELSEESLDVSTDDSSLDESLSESLDESLSETLDESVSESVSESLSESLDESLSISKRPHSNVSISSKTKSKKNARKQKSQVKISKNKQQKYKKRDGKLKRGELVDETDWIDDTHPEGRICSQPEKKRSIEKKDKTIVSKSRTNLKKWLNRPKERDSARIVRMESIKTEQGTGDAEVMGPAIQRDQVIPRRIPKTRTRKVGVPVVRERKQRTQRVRGDRYYDDKWYQACWRYIRRKIRRCIDKDKKMVTCECRPCLTKTQELSAYRSDFRGKFRDGVRMIDLIVVVKDDGDRKADRLRMKFLVAALKTGLEFELETGIMPVNNHLIFIKVHGPPEIIDRYGEAYGIRRFYRQQHLYCTHQPERDFLRIVRQNYPPPNYYSSLDRSLIVYKIFLHLPYGQRFEDYGINKLIALDIFRDAYALHDGPAFLVDCQNPGLATARQILFHNWAQALWCKCFCSMPFSLVQEYMGDRVAYYFAFAEYYNRALVLLGFTSIIFLILQGSRWYLFLSKDADEAIQAFCNDTIITGAKACPECVHDKKVCRYKDMRAYCETYKYYYRLLDDGRLVYYSLFVCFWTTIFTYKWKVRERKLRWKWENSKELAKAELRPMHRKLPAVFRDCADRAAYYGRIAISTLLSIALVIAWLVATHMFLLEKGPFKKLMEKFRGIIEKLVWKKIFDAKKWKKIKELDVITVGNMFFTSLVYALVAMVFGVICKWLSYFLVCCERHTVFSLYERSLAKKLFILSAVTVFPLMVYHCFLKIIGLQMLDEPPWLPAYEILNIDLFKLLHIEPFFSRNCGPSGSCLHQISAILLATWIVFQLVYPILKYIFRWLFNVKDWRRRVPVWETEYLLPPMTDKMIMDRYDFLITQYGLCTLFIQTFPLLPIICALINQYDFRYSARLFLCSHRRPLFPRFSGIGTWRSILTFISYTTLFFHAIVIAYHTVFPENIGFHNYHHEDYKEGYVPHLNPFNKNATTGEIDVTDYAKFLVAAFPLWRYNYSAYIRNYTSKLENKPKKYCLYSGQHRYNYEMTDFICGSECYNVRNIRLQVYAVYLIFFGLVLPLIFTLFDRGFSAGQVSIAERRIQRAYYHGDQKRGGYDPLDYRYLYCPSGECYKSHSY